MEGADMKIWDQMRILLNKEFERGKQDLSGSG
jgi:hypothetical protein